MDRRSVISETRVYTQAEFDAFARLSGDDNPIHVDPNFAAQTRFGRTVAHGMFLYSTICGALNRHFPGAVQKEQHLKFPAPTFAGEPLEIRLDVRQKDNNRLRVATEIFNEAGECTCEGECVLIYE